MAEKKRYPSEIVRAFKLPDLEQMMALYVEMGTDEGLKRRIDRVQIELAEARASVKEGRK